MILPDAYLFTAHTQLITGRGCRNQIRGVLDSHRLNRPFLITGGDMSVDNSEYQADCVGEYRLSSDHASFRQVDEVKTLMEEAECDCIIAAGGSGVIDTSKAAGLFPARPGQRSDPDHADDTGELECSAVPIIAIPTMSGAYTSALRFTTVFDHDKGRPQLISSGQILPRSVILDSETAFTEKPLDISSAAMEALAYAVDAFTGLGKNPLSDGLAFSALKLLYPAMLEAVSTTSSGTASSSLLEGAYLSGQASSNSMPGILYALCQTLSALCNIPHRACAAILLPYSLEYNHHKISGFLDELSVLFDDGKEVADPLNFPDFIRTINRSLYQMTSGDHVWRFHDIMDKQGRPLMRPDHIHYAARMAMDSWMGFNNPEQADFEDMRRIIQAAYWGYPLDRELVMKGHQR
jgi:alcohol dehydrogenase